MDERSQLIQHLSLDIDRLLAGLDAEADRPLSALDHQIIRRALLGQTRKQIAVALQVSDACIRDQLSHHIYPRLADHFQVEKGAIAGNWALILNLLLHPERGYRLQPAPQLNSDNLQCSFGRQVFLYGRIESGVQAQVEGTQFYQQGLYYQASQCFLAAWRQSPEPLPETLIYLNNSLIEQGRTELAAAAIPIYAIAVVVPFNHNQGAIATEILRGLAQLQLQINRDVLRRYPSLDATLCAVTQPATATLLAQNNFVLKLLIVNDPNHLHDPYNQTAQRLAALSAELSIMAVIGHYSSEMTRKALHFYAQTGIALVNASSTADELAQTSPGEQLSFFRITTPDRPSAACLIHHLAHLHRQPASLAIIYNRKSLYSCSYRRAIHQCLHQYGDQLQLQSECDFMGDDFYQVQNYLNSLRRQPVDQLIVIPDGGIEPNSLNNLGLISRLIARQGLIAGSATFYQENVLHWLQEQSPPPDNTAPLPVRLIACVPWHHQQVTNAIGHQFCRLGEQLWGLPQLTWRSATAFDAGLVIAQVLTQQQPQDAQTLLMQMHQYYKQAQTPISGVTGTLQFLPNGDRLAPPAVIVTVQQETAPGRWGWHLWDATTVVDHPDS